MHSDGGNLHPHTDIKEKKESRQPAAARSWTIADDILIDILFRLPLSSLLRIRYTCKRWLSLTRNPSFVYLHLNRSRASGRRGFIALSQDNSYPPKEYNRYPAHLTLLDESGRPDGPPMRIDPHRPFLQMSPPCNGIVCIYSNATAHLHNPTTKELLLLPKPTAAYTFTCLLAFIRTNSQYKVLRFYDDHQVYQWPNRPTYCSCEVLTVGCGGGGLWRRISGFCHAKPPIDGCTIDGVVYFTTQGSKGKREILSFDPRDGDEKFRKVAFPNPSLLSDERTKVFELGGLLCLAQHNYRPLMTIWVLEDGAWSSRRYPMPFSVIGLESSNRPLLLRDRKVLLLETDPLPPHIYEAAFRDVEGKDEEWQHIHEAPFLVGEDEDEYEYEDEYEDEEWQHIYWAPPLVGKGKDEEKRVIYTDKHLVDAHTILPSIVSLASL